MLKPILTAARYVVIFVTGPYKSIQYNTIQIQYNKVFVLKNNN